MNVIRKAVSALGGIFLAALLIAALAPKVTRGLAAALVRDVDQPARRPFTTSCTASIIRTSEAQCFTPSIPSGGEFVIETVSLQAHADSGNTRVLASLEVTTA